jgi:hypothetical protein
MRLSGTLNSLLGKSSWYRPKIDFDQWPGKSIRFSTL